MLTNVSHAHYITSMMAYVPSSVYNFLGRMAYVPSSAYNFLGRMAYVPSSAYNFLGRMAYVPSSAYKFPGRMAYVPSSAYKFPGRMAYIPSSAYIHIGRMAYVPSSVHENHVLANAPHVPNIQKISNTDTDTLSNPNTHSLSFNIIYTPKSEIISHYKRSYPKAIVPHWFEISEFMSYETAIKSDTQILKITSTVDTNFDRTICFKFDITSCPLDFRISNYIRIQILSFCIKLRSSPILTFYIHFLLSILSIIASLPLTTTCTATASQQPHFPIASAHQHASGFRSGVVG